jgi:hypothetical protein
VNSCARSLTTASCVDADFGDAQAGEAVEAFLDRQTLSAPAPPKLMRHHIGEREDDGLAACAILGAPSALDIPFHPRLAVGVTGPWSRDADMASAPDRAVRIMVWHPVPTDVTPKAALATIPGVPPPFSLQPGTACDKAKFVSTG